jgi:hypothetical protein
MLSIQERLMESRERFKRDHGVYPIAMRLGTELYKRVSTHPAWAIETTLVVESQQILPWAVVLVKPPEIRNESKQDSRG